MGLLVVSVDWGSYQPFDPGVSAPLRELARGEARAAFDRLMAAKDARIEALRGLLAGNGMELGTSEDAVQELNDWFRAEVEADPNKAGWLRPMWYSVVNDIALFLGDLIIQRAPMIQWTFFVWGARDVSFQCHVLMGFTKVKNPKYNVDIDRLVSTYGHRIIHGEQVEENVFWLWVESSVSIA